MLDGLYQYRLGNGWAVSYRLGNVGWAVSI